jgi:hypothetical protein
MLPKVKGDKFLVWKKLIKNHPWHVLPVHCFDVLEEVVDVLIQLVPVPFFLRIGSWIEELNSRRQ